MAKKTHPEKVHPALAKLAIDSGKDLSALYSQCVAISWRTTGRLAPGFDNADLIAYIRANEKLSALFDEKGRRIQPTPQESQ